jgi:hypothetical protein
VVPDNEELGMTLENVAAWIEEWAGYNQRASRHGGYVVR